MTIAPASLANLRKPWTSATSPKVGRSCGASLAEWLNRLSKRSEAALQIIAEDPSATVEKRKAAKSHLRSLSDEVAKNGNPHAMADLNFQADRTEGKATQRVEVTRVEVADPRALMVRLAEVLAESPALQKALGVSLGGVLGSDATEGAGAPNAVQESG